MRRQYLNHAPPRPEYYLRPGDNGVDNIPDAFTANGVTVKPTFVYRGIDASATQWLATRGYGETLTTAGAGAAPVPNQLSPLLGGSDVSCGYLGAKYHQASGNAFADITTGDFVLRCIFRTGSDVTTLQYILAKRIAAAGYHLAINGGNAEFYAEGAGGNKTLTASAVVANCCYDVEILCDVSSATGLQSFTQGVLTVTDNPTAIGSLTIAQPFTIGALSDGSNPILTGGSIAYASLHKRAAWLDTAEFADLAMESHKRATGYYPQIANGTALPTVSTRATAANLDKLDSSGNRKTFLVGPGWFRSCERVDGNGDTIRGALIETAATNLIPWSEEIGAAESSNWWTQTNCSDSNTTTCVLPDGKTSVRAAIKEDATAADEHKLTSSAISFTATKTYCYSFLAKPVNRDFLKFAIVNNSVPIRGNWDVTNGVVGTSSMDGIDLELWDATEGIYRCWCHWVHDATEGVTFDVLVCDADDSDSFNGANQDSVIIWGQQLETGVTHPTSYIPTLAGATVTRNADVIYYKGDDGNLGGVGSELQGAFEAGILLDSDFGGDGHIASLSDGGSANERLLFYVTSADKLRMVATVGGVTQLGLLSTADVIDGKTQIIRGLWRTDNGKIFVNEAEEAEDTAGNIPNDLDRINIGSKHSGANQFNGLIEYIKIWRRPVRR